MSPDVTKYQISLEIISVHAGRKHTSMMSLISKYTTTSISKRKMELDPTCLDIWIFY